MGTLIVMLRSITALVLALLTTVAVTSTAVAMSFGHGDGQPLSIAISEAGSRVQHLDGYAATRPIAVAVEAPRAHAVTLIGHAPDGSTLRVPLVPVAEGRFAAEVTLGAPGVWALAVSSRVGPLETASQAFAISVVTDRSRAALGIVLGLALASLLGGIGLIVLGVWRSRTRPVASAG